ncbi:MAG: DNA primase, partial [Pseudomonadota bacterium]
MPRFSPDFLDELRARLRASDVIGRHVKLKKEGREYRGLSPFTTEKTPSFFVNDEKARFFDFSSGKSGDIVGFMMETQNLSFPEAVTALAELAGMEIPKDTPEDERRARVAKDIEGANLEAAKFFRSMLTRSEGREALAYLERRGVSENARQTFGLGYAPSSRTALKDHLINKDFPLDLLAEAGLVIKPDDGGSPYDKFRDRVMFPILGRRGVIAFGGRALSKDVQAKYMNSPETALFHKSATLYHFDRARKKQAESKGPLLVAEGYMDVIALHEAGFAAVAPLGTAITERQLEMLWRAVDTPVMCLDGDRAGRSAAFRAIDRALPILKPGKSLSFVFLPDGQ